MARAFKVKHNRRPRGSAYILSLILVTMFAAMAIAYSSQSSLNLIQSDNFGNSIQSRLATESGVDFMLLSVRPIRITESSDLSVLTSSLAAKLNERFQGSPNLSGPITTSGSKITVPSISFDNKAFTTEFNWISPTVCRMTVRGNANSITRRIDIDLVMTVKRSPAFDYGLASRGPISIGGNARLIGVNDPSEASILSTTSSGTAITVDGNSTISGDLSVTGDSSDILIKGTPTIGNTNDPALFSQHCHFGVEPPDFPVYSTAPLASLATLVIDSTTNLSNLSSINNVRIKAGTNPVFNNHMVVNGIVFVEAPNSVRFEGQATVNGLIVTQEASPSQLSSCQIFFAGGVEAYGVEALPNTPEFAAVKQQKGTFILAPGFGLTFAGHVSAVNGTIAADQLTFTGSAEGVVRGSVIGLRDIQTSLGGTIDIYVDHQNAQQEPAGFVRSYAVVPDPATYYEIIEGS